MYSIITSWPKPDTYELRVIVRFGDDEVEVERIVGTGTPAELRRVERCVIARLNEKPKN